MENVKLVSVKPLGKGKKVQTREMSQEAARDLLKYEKARGFNEWTLPKDSPYQMDPNGNLIKRAGLATDKGAEASKGNQAGTGEKDEA